MENKRGYDTILKRIFLSLFLAAVLCGCMGGTGGPSQARGEDEGLISVPSIVQGPVNAKEDFYKNAKLLPVVDGYEIAVVGGGKLPVDEGPGMLIDYMTSGTYVSDSMEGFNVNVYDIRTGMGMLLKSRFDELRETQVDGATAYINDKGGASGSLEVQWPVDGHVYVVGAESTNEAQILNYASVVMKSATKLNLDVEENEWMLLYRYLPEPPEDENLHWFRIVNVPFTSITALYGTGELEYNLNIVTGEGARVSILGLEGEASSTEEIQVAGKTATAGYKEGKYTISYLDEEKQIGLAAGLEKGNLTDAKPALVNIMEAAMTEAGLV